MHRLDVLRNQFIGRKWWFINGPPRGDSDLFSILFTPFAGSTAALLYSLARFWDDDGHRWPDVGTLAASRCNWDILRACVTSLSPGEDGCYYFLDLCWWFLDRFRREIATYNCNSYRFYASHVQLSGWLCDQTRQIDWHRVHAETLVRHASLYPATERV